jgi:hypothetical protein
VSCALVDALGADMLVSEEQICEDCYTSLSKLRVERYLNRLSPLRR